MLESDAQSIQQSNIYIVPFFRDGEIEALRAFRKLEDAYAALSDWFGKPALDAIALRKWPNDFRLKLA